jgi:predicted PurR-regulated permease PerM
MNWQGWLLTVVVLGGSVAFLIACKAMLAPFIAGLILAYLISPIVGGLTRIGMPRSLAAALPVALALVALGVLVALGLPLLIEQLALFAAKLPGYLNTLQTSVVPPGLARTLHLRNFNNDVLLKSLGFLGTESAGWMLTSMQKLYSGAVTAFNMLLLVVMTPLVAFYLLHDWPDLPNRVINTLPRRWRPESRQMVHEIDLRLAAYLRGQLAVCAVLAMYYAIALELIGLELGWALGIMAGLLAFIPVVGALVAVSTMMLMVLVQYQLVGWEPYALVLAIYAAGNMLESSILVPALVGRQVGLHPVWVIFALLAGGELGGILGMLLAVPAAVIVSVALPRLIRAWHETAEGTAKAKGGRK